MATLSRGGHRALVLGAGDSAVLLLMRGTETGLAISRPWASIFCPRGLLPPGISYCWVINSVDVTTAWTPVF